MRDSRSHSVTLARPAALILPPLTLALLLAAPGPAPLAAQETGAIAGTVVSEGELQPLPGAQVSVSGTGIGALTDERGQFRLTGVPQGEVEVEVRLISYRSVSRSAVVRAGEVTSLEFRLSPSAVVLEEIVVTGTAGATRRKELGNAVSTLNVAELDETVQAASVDELIAGRTSGLVALTGTGATGAGPRIKIRGTASLSLGEQPLIYVDGVRVNNDIGAGPNSQGYGAGIISRLGDFSPEEIERIEIVKGPAAATLYGTEATNGVIQIFTKRGTADRAATWNVEVMQGATWLHDPEGEIPGIWGVDPETGQVRDWKPILMETEAGNNVFRTGHQQSYAANVQGGAAEMGYFLSGAYERLQGVYPTNNVWRLNSRANLNFEPHPDWTLQGSAGYVKANLDLPNDIGASPIFNAMYSFPFLVPTPNRGFLIAPPEWLYAEEQNRQELDRFTGSLRIEHGPAEWFQHRLTVGLDHTEEDNIVQAPFLGPEAVQFFGPTGSRGGRFLEKNSVIYITADYSATVERPIFTDVVSETSLGLQYYAREAHAATTEGDEFAAPGLRTVSSTARRFAGEEFVRNVTLGTFLQQRLGWKDRRFMTVAVRVDNNSAFGEDFEFAAYPKVSGSWVVSEEPFWDVGFMPSLRFRAAYGQTGQQPESFSALRFYLPVTTGEGQPGIKPESPGNPDLAPERGSELETGFDATLFGDRLGLDFTFYAQTISDVLLQRILAPSTGFPGTQWDNVGKVRSRGVELGLNATPVRTDNVTWDVNVQFSRNWNEVLDVGNARSGTTAAGDDYIILDTMLDTPGIEIRHQEGLPPGSWFGWKVVSAELDADGNPINVLCDGGPTATAPVPCEQAPFVFLGQSEPKIQGSFGSTVTLLGDLVLSGFVDFQFGQRHGDNDTIVQCQLFRVCRENFFPTEYAPELIAEFSSARYSSFAVADAGFAKLRNVSLGYHLPGSLAGLVGAQRAQITLTARNLATWTNWPSLDPETYFTEPTSTSPLFDRSSQAFTPHPIRVQATLSLTF